MIHLEQEEKGNGAVAWMKVVGEGGVGGGTYY